MFDALKKGLTKFKRDVVEEVETEFEIVGTAPAPPKAAPPAPKPAPPAAKPAPPAAKPAPAKAAPPAAPKAAPARPAAPGKPAAPPPKVEAERRFDRELAQVVDTPGAPASHDLQGAEFEEGDRTKVPVPPAVLPAPPGPLRRPPLGMPEPAPPQPPRAGRRSIDPDRVRDLLFDLEVSLLESDVALPTAEAILKDLERAIPEIRVDRTEDIPPAVEEALRRAVRKVLDVGTIDFDGWVLEQPKPVVVMFVGVNGTGKTTAIGRVAHRLQSNGIGCVMAAGDTFRAGAIEQLQRHGDNLGLTVIKTQAGGDPAAVAYDAVEHAKARKRDVVLLDTAGRMQTNTNLMDEMKKIKRVAKPAMIVFVGDSLAGNDAVEQAVQFDKAVGIDAVVLTKVDTDAKGGAALSIAHAVGKPVLFLGVGQEYADLIPYDPDWMVSRIFD